MAKHGVDRPGAGGDERDDEFIEVIDLCLQEPRRAAPVPAAGHDWRSRVRRRGGPQRRADPRGFSTVRAVVRPRTAGRHDRACCPLREGHDGQNGTRVAR